MRYLFPKSSRCPVVLGLVMLALIISTRWVRVNASSSAPYGLYALRPAQPPFAQGQWVILAAPASVRPWVSWWRRLLKPVAAVPGTQVCVYDNHLFIGGEDFGPVYTSADGKVLPRITGCTTIQDGEVFLASRARGVLDGRYFGVTNVHAIRAEAVPVWTWGD